MGWDKSDNMKIDLTVTFKADQGLLDVLTLAFSKNVPDVVVQKLTERLATSSSALQAAVDANQPPAAPTT